MKYIIEIVVKIINWYNSLNENIRQLILIQIGLLFLLGPIMFIVDLILN